MKFVPLDRRGNQSPCRGFTFLGVDAYMRDIVKGVTTAAGVTANQYRCKPAQGLSVPGHQIPPKFGCASDRPYLGSGPLVKLRPSRPIHYSERRPAP